VFAERGLFVAARHEGHYRQRIASQIHHVTELAAGLERRGHEIHVFTRRAYDQSTYECINGVHYHRVDHGISDSFVETMDWMCKALVHRFSEVTSVIGKFELISCHDWLTANCIPYIWEGFGTPSVLTMHSTEYSRSGNELHEGIGRWIRKGGRRANRWWQLPLGAAANTFGMT
jgi:glycogen synthase